MKMLKVHGSNNDFFILPAANLTKPLSEAELKALAQKLCDRTSGLHGGADGVLYVTPGHDTSVAGKMRVINADGSEASMCGNGLRTVARYLSTQTGLTDFKVETMHADLEVKAAPAFAEGVPAFDVEISPVSFKAEDLLMHIGKEQLINEKVPQLGSDLKFTAVAVPNPHLISFVDHETLMGEELGRIATYLNDGQNPLFPDGVNVSFVEVLATNKIFVRTYERGVGYTNACGTAMSASSLIYSLLYPETSVEDLITVINPGGMVKTKVHQRQDGSYWMSLIGNASFVAEVELEQADAMQGDFTKATWNETGEQAAYEDFVANLKK